MMYKKILLATDGSECAEKAAKQAIIIAGQNNAELIVLNVLETHSLAGLPVEGFTHNVNELFRREGIDALERISHIFKELSQKKSFVKGVKLTLKTEEGHPADMILQTVDEQKINLVVIGASGKHAVERFILGSVAEKVVRHAKCPVLTVH